MVIGAAIAEPQKQWKSDEIDELESGGSIDEAKLRRIANALKLPENIFSG